MLPLPAEEAADLSTVAEIFVNGSIAPERLHGAFGVCYVAFAGTHEKRYRGEKLLEIAARQLTAALGAHREMVPQCVATDQPERPRPYVQLSIPLRTPLDATPCVASCAEYTRRFKRPCKLLFGYMAKAIAVARAPYSATVFVDTDTFFCDPVPLLAIGRRLLAKYDLLLHMPRTNQGWVNSGVLGVRREAARGWATAWQREFTSLDDFGDQLHLLKVLPPRAADQAPQSKSDGGEADGATGGGGGGGGEGGGRGGGGRLRGRGGGRWRVAPGSLNVGELPPELHLRVGNTKEDALTKLPPLRAPPMILHSKGLASLSAFTPFFAQQFARAGPGGAPLAPSRQYLVEALGDGSPEARRKGEHALYSARALAGFCLMLGDGWDARPQAAAITRQLMLNTNGTCTGCARLPRVSGAVGVLMNQSANPSTSTTRFECSETVGECGIVPAQWPDGTERGLPDWFVTLTQQRTASGSARASRAEL
jgi:uncharacterized membrane protein YgcG